MHEMIMDSAINPLKFLLIFLALSGILSWIFYEWMVRREIKNNHKTRKAAARKWNFVFPLLTALLAGMMWLIKIKFF